MSTDKELELPAVVQRQALREQMRAQRTVIEHRLDPQPSSANPQYPRSATMRFLTRHPGLASALLGEAAAMLVGVRVLKSVGRAIAITRIVRATGRDRQRQRQP